MARARNIKPSIMDNEQLAELPALHRLLFIYMWMLADREGRLEDRPKRIAVQALPYDRDADADQMLTDLQAAGFIRRYVVDGERLICILAFTKHQTPHMRESGSSLPAPDGGTGKAVPKHNQGSAEHKSSPSDTGFSDCGLPDTGLSDSSAPAEATPDDVFALAWNAYPKRPGASKADAHKAWKARVKACVPPAVMYAGVLRYAAYCHACETEPQFVKQPTTFFGPGEHYASDWTPPPRAAPRNGNKHAAAAQAIWGSTETPQDYVDV